MNGRYICVLYKCEFARCCTTQNTRRVILRGSLWRFGSKRDDFQTRLHWTNDYGSLWRSHQPIQRHYSIVARRLCLLTLSLAKKFVINLMSANNANPILRRLGIKGELTGGHFISTAALRGYPGSNKPTFRRGREGGGTYCIWGCCD